MSERDTKHICKELIEFIDLLDNVRKARADLVKKETAAEFYKGSQWKDKEIESKKDLAKAQSKLEYCKAKFSQIAIILTAKINEINSIEAEIANK